MYSLPELKEKDDVLKTIGRRILQGCAAIILSGLLTNSAAAQSPAGVDRIEEDWVLVLKTPTPAIATPQIQNVMSPFPHVNGHYGILCLNHGTDPDFVAGGIQMTRYYGADLMSYQPRVATPLLANAGERITYSMSMKIQGGKLSFSVLNGKSQTMGTFGGDTTPWMTDVTTSLTDLSGYSPLVSATYTEVAYGTNAVDSLTLKSVRYYKNNKLTKSDDPNYKVRVFTAQ